MVRGIKQPAEFERPLYQASIKENLRPGHPIINVVFNGSLSSYEFVPQDNACWKDFDINRKSGLVANKVNITLLLTCYREPAVISGDGNALVIQASDADVSGSDLMYEVVGCSAFRIDSQTGELLAAEVRRVLPVDIEFDPSVWPL